MARNYINLKYDEIREKFRVFCVHRKKIKALENFSEVKRFPGSKYISILKELIKDGFLEREEAEFLEYQLEKAECNFYIWNHKTKWVKSQILRAKTVRKPSMQLTLPLDGVKAIKVPAMPMAHKSTVKQPTARA
jgi:hypothetical protein